MAERVIEGDLQAQGKRFAVVVSRWNEFFGEQLLRGALDALRRHGASLDDVVVVRCPGSWELAQAAGRLLRATKPGGIDAVICLGVLIRGSTPHFDFIAGGTTGGIDRLAAETGVPVTYGVITCDNLEQAIERSGSKAGNKGAEAAIAAIEMARLFEAIDAQGDEDSGGSGQRI